MALVPERQHSTARAIHQWYEAKIEPHREHLGASLIGHHCDRYLWLTFHWAIKPEHNGRLLRLFNTGKREEDRIFEELRGVGVELHTDEDGEQIQCRDETGHFGGSLDGIGKGFPESPNTWAVLECKTMNDKSFAQLVVKGVQEEKPQHYAQMQAYMGLMNLDRAMYIAVNKNTDDLHTEWVHFDKAAFDKAMDRAKRIIEARTPPLKISQDPSHWLCKFCDMYSLCHQQKIAEVNCRTCCHSTAVQDGKWGCEVRDCEIPRDTQVRACPQHLFIPDLVPSADAVDGGEGTIEYVDRVSRETFKNGPGATSSRVIRGRKRELKPEGPKGIAPNGGIPFDDEIPF